MSETELQSQFKKWLEEFSQQVQRYETAQEIMGTLQLPEDATGKIGAYAVDEPEIHAQNAKPLKIA